MAMRPKKDKTNIDNKVATRRKNVVRQVIKNSKAATSGSPKPMPSTKSEQFKNRMPSGINAVRTKDTLPLSDKRGKVQPLLKKNKKYVQKKMGK
jgi:hypothetical protein